MKKKLIGVIFIVLIGICIGILSFQNPNINENKAEDASMQEPIITSITIVEPVTKREKSLMPGYDDKLIVQCLELLEEEKSAYDEVPKYDVSIMFNNGISKNYSIVSAEKEQCEFFEEIMSNLVKQL